MFSPQKSKLVRQLCWIFMAAALAVGCGTPEPPDRSPWVLQVTGEEYRWIATYPGPDEKLGTADDVESSGEIRVPQGRPLTLDLTSRDYLYTLAIAEFGVRQIAVPDMVFSVELQPDRPGRFHLVGDQLCGFSHDSLMADFVVVRQPEFKKWTAQLPPAGSARPEV